MRWKPRERRERRRNFSDRRNPPLVAREHDARSHDYESQRAGLNSLSILYQQTSRVFFEVAEISGAENDSVPERGQQESQLQEIAGRRHVNRPSSLPIVVEDIDLGETKKQWNFLLTVTGASESEEDS